MIIKYNIFPVNIGFKWYKNIYFTWVFKEC